MIIDSNGTRLNVVEGGSAHPLTPITFVFLHYFGGSAQEWVPVMDRVGTHLGARCLAIDLRGFGDSAAPPTGYSVDDMADDVAGVLAYYDLPGSPDSVLPDENYVLVGHSMSGKVALALAARQPGGMFGLVLLAPSPPSPEPIADEARQQMMQTHGTRAAAEKTGNEITAAPLSDASREQIIADNLRSATVAWDAWLTSGSKEDITDRMPRINTVVHVAVGGQDTNIPLALLQTAVMPLLPKSATLHIIPGAAHLPTYEAPDAVVAILELALVK